MKKLYTYKFHDGNITLEIDEANYNLLITLDQEEYNQNRKHQRHYPVSLENTDYEGDWFDDGSDIAGDLEHQEDHKALCQAIAELLPAQQELVRKIFFEGRTIASVAAEEHVSEAAIRDRLKRIHQKLKIFLE